MKKKECENRRGRTYDKKQLHTNLFVFNCDIDLTNIDILINSFNCDIDLGESVLNYLKKRANNY